MTTSNLYRKARALVAKTEANGCTNGEAASALQTASDIIAKNGLDSARIEWPTTPPKGYRVEGKLGVDAKVVKMEERIKETAAKASKAKTTRTKPIRAHKEGQKTQPERMLELLRRPEGVSLDELTEALEIQAHSARALISVHARKKAGLKVVVEKGRYRIVDE